MKSKSDSQSVPVSSHLMEGTVAKLVLHIHSDPVGEQELDHVDLTNESSVSG